MKKRLRIFAGPNGSGKSTLVQQLKDRIPLYTVLNADELLVTIKVMGKYTHSVPIEKSRLTEFAASTTYPDVLKEIFASSHIRIEGCEIFFDIEARTNQVAAVLTEFFKEDLLQRGESFTFETVFSHPSKIAFIRRAHELGYRTYLYFVATESPTFNIARVRERVENGGHDVPEDKIVSRYHKALRNVKGVLPFLTRGYFFDNSREEMMWVLEYNEEDKSLSAYAESPEWLCNLFLSNL